MRNSGGKSDGGAGGFQLPATLEFEERSVGSEVDRQAPEQGHVLGEAAPSTSNCLQVKAS